MHLGEERTQLAQSIAFRTGSGIVIKSMIIVVMLNVNSLVTLLWSAVSLSINELIRQLFS